MITVARPVQPSAIFSRFRNSFRRRTVSMPDLRHVSDHFKRDIGLLEGQVLPGDLHELTR
jgi:hypothetical protein